LKNRIENISSLIEGWCKKKLVFARPFLPFGTVGEANTQAYTFAIRTSQHTGKKLQKSMLFANALKQTDND